MSKTTTKPAAVAVALASGILLAGSTFAMEPLAQGYLLAAPEAAKAGEGKCGEGKCGGQAAKAAHEGGCGMAKMDTDKDGRLSRAEFDAAHKGSEEKFAGHDLDGDGFITQAEMDKHHADMKAKGDGKAATEGKCGEGKCGEGKCGGNK